MFAYYIIAHGFAGIARWTEKRFLCVYTDTVTFSRTIRNTQTHCQSDIDIDLQKNSAPVKAANAFAFINETCTINNRQTNKVVSKKVPALTLKYDVHKFMYA